MKLFIIAILFLLSIAAAAPRVAVLSFTMSKCPDCEAFGRQFQSTVLDQEGLSSIINFHEESVAKSDPSDPSGFNCLHGTGECYGDMLQLCANNLTAGPENLDYKWWNMTLCMYKDRSGIPDNFERCANNAGFTPDVQDSIYKCAHGDLGHTLMQKSVDDCQKYSIQWAPTVFVDGKEAPVENPDYLRMICDAYTGTKPVVCNK